MQSPDLTPVHLVTIIAAAVFSPAVAEVVGPYVVIGICSMGGAAVMIAQREGDNRTLALVYFLGAVMFALVGTVPLAAWSASLYDPIQADWLYGPIGGLLAYSADKWTRVIFPFISGKVSALIDAWIAARGPR